MNGFCIVGVCDGESQHYQEGHAFPLFQSVILIFHQCVIILFHLSNLRYHLWCSAEARVTTLEIPIG